jgi:PAS domain S-box-containing protein
MGAAGPPPVGALTTGYHPKRIQLAHFICPNCKDRSIDADGYEGLSRQPVGCRRCGFGFLFQILDDYYPHPEAGLVACDQQTRVLAAGRGVFELTGYREQDLIGRPVGEALHLNGFDDGKDPIATSVEWGVRQLNERGRLRHASGREKPIVCDVFPALDDDGGLLLALAPPNE